jgi:LytS/YehU family sensor histidine kinase
LTVQVNVLRPDASCVELTVRNTGHWADPKPREKASHLGLKNLQRRLELLYADQHHLDIQTSDGWVAVHIRIPTT